MIEDFNVKFTEKEISLIYQKVRDYPWDSVKDLDGWEHGTNKKYLKELCKSIKVVISNSSCPGEGEQKIFRYLRKVPDDGVNVIHGLDADLIMLSLLPQAIEDIRNPVISISSFLVAFFFLEHALDLFFLPPADNLRRLERFLELPWRFDFFLWHDFFFFAFLVLAFVFLEYLQRDDFLHADFFFLEQALDFFFLAPAASLVERRNEFS